MISSRFAPLVLVLVLLALVPTLIHSYVGLRVEDLRVIAAVPQTLAGLPSRPTDRRRGSLDGVLQTHDWIERRHIKPNGGDIILFIARSYDAKRLYHHPENAVVHGVDLRNDGVVLLEGPPAIPAHVLRGDTTPHLALYALLYEDRLVERPLVFQLRLAGELLFRGRRPMTLFFALDPAPDVAGALENTAAAKLLREAVHSFLEQTPTSIGQ